MKLYIAKENIILKKLVVVITKTDYFKWKSFVSLNNFVISKFFVVVFNGKIAIKKLVFFSSIVNTEE